MSKLLSTEFRRLFKSSLYKWCMLLSGVLSAVLIILRWRDVCESSAAYANLPAEYSKADDMLFMGSLFMLFVIAIFTGMFAGTEYSDGTIRNKLIVGHKRSSIYISKLVVCSTANIILHAISVIVAWGLGSLLLGVDMQYGELLTRTCMLFFIIISMTALMLLFAMLIQSKSIGSVACLSFMIIMILAAGYVQNRLDTPEYYGGYIYVDEETNEYIEEGQQKNPSYLSGKKREVYEIVFDVLPTGQMLQVCYRSPKNSIMLYDVIILIGAASAGIVLFKKKNLK